MSTYIHTSSRLLHATNKPARARALPPTLTVAPRSLAQQHTYDFFDKGTGAGFVRFRTTSQNFYDYDTKALTVGESNQGIVSEKSKWFHKQQEK